MLQPFQLTAANPNISTALGFVARSVYVDNYTTGYVTIKGVNRSIPPFTVGAVVTLDGPQIADAVLGALGSGTGGPSVVPFVGAVVIYTDANVAPSPGVVLPSQQNSSPVNWNTPISLDVNGNPLTRAVNALVSAGTGLNLIPARPGVTLRLFTSSFGSQSSAQTFMELNDTQVNFMHAFQCLSPSGVTNPMMMQGQAWIPGNGIEFDNVSATDVIMRGGIIYSNT